MRFLLITVVLLVAASLAGASPKFSLEGMFDYETTQTSLLFWPDPSGGVGVMVVSDSSVPGHEFEDVAIGPKIEFKLDPVLKTALGVLLPWANVPEDIPAEFYGSIAGTWNTFEDNAFTSWFGTSARLLPGNFIQPTISAEYVQPEGGSQELRAMFGATIRF